MPTRTFKIYERFCQKIIPLAFLLCFLISMIGCPQRYVVIPPGETVQANKTQLDQLYRDNENLLKALEQCRKGK